MSDPPQTFPNRFPESMTPGSAAAADKCDCAQGRRDNRFHGDRQDTTAPGWIRLLELIDQAAADRREEFRPLTELSPQQRRQIVTLPATIAKLTEVKHFVLYGSNLVRIPVQISAMRALEVFEPYTSRRLHWFPYELTRCAGLRDSTISTRELYGNFKTRTPFPRLLPPQAVPADVDPGVWGADEIRTCSVCDRSLADVDLHQAWLSARIGTDVVPLLVNACSPACLEALPAGAKGHVATFHTGEPDLVQPQPW